MGPAGSPRWPARDYDGGSDGRVMRILLVEDEPHAAHVLAKGLREQAYAVDVAADGEAALFQAGHDRLRRADPRRHAAARRAGFAVCRSIRESGSAVPILMLTARDAVEARIEGLDCGADDYLVKPYDFGELLARLRALIRRGRQPVLPERMVVGSLTIDTRRRSALVRNRGDHARRPRSTRSSNTSRAARATSSAAATSPNTSGTNTTIRCRTSSTCTFSACAASSRRRGSESLIRTRRGEGLPAGTGDDRMRTLSLRARLTLWYTLALLVVVLCCSASMCSSSRSAWASGVPIGSSTASRRRWRICFARKLELDSPALAATEARNAIGPLGDAIAILDCSGTRRSPCSSMA